MKITDRRLILAIAVSMLSAGLARGQAPADIPVAPFAATTETQTVAQAPAPAPATPNQAVDETALRYFARQGDTRRVEAEIARLRALYPDWQPPENLLADDYVPDPAIERMWELYSQGDFAGARAAIADKQATDPAFVPSEELLRSLDLGEAGVRLRNASDALQYQTVITIAANQPELLTCASVDNMWRLAEAFIKTGNTPRGLDAYSYILTNCTNPEERLATLQKAMVLLGRSDIEPLLALEQPDAQGTGEFVAIRLDLARNAVADVLTGKAARAPQGDLDLLENQAQQTRLADDLRLLGWYELNQKRPSQGREWFEMAMEEDPSVLSAHGMGVALLDLRRPGEAEAVLADYRDESEELTTLYLTAAASTLAQEPRVQVEPEVLDRIVEETMAASEARTAQELGWYAYAFSQAATAAAWFKLAVTWDPEDEPSAYGLLVASDALKDTETVRSIKSLWSARSERIANFGRAGAATTIQTPPPMPEQRPQRASPPVQQASTRPAPVPAASTSSGGGGGTSSGRGCANFVPPTSLSPAQALTRGWCLMDLARPTDAIANFARALQSPNVATRSDAAYGQTLAFIRLGLTDDAAVAAAAAPLSPDRVIELQISIHTQAALRAYEMGDYRRTLIALDERARYGPEQNDLLTLRAWCYFHLKRIREAKQIFTAVAATGYGAAVEGLNAVRATEPQPQ